MKSTTTRWLLECAIGAIALIFACGIATAWFGTGLQVPSITTRDGSLITLNRYAREPVPDVVLVGSSLTYRLSEPYFSTARLRNLALAGGSPLTGLEIVAGRSQLPKLILVETNVWSRPPDLTLVEKYRAADGGGSLFFRPIRMAIAAYESWRHAPLGSSQAAAANDRIVNTPPVEFDNRVYVERVIAEANEGDLAPATRDNAAQIKRLVASIEDRGSIVRFFELPYPDEVQASRFVRMTREIAHDAYPDPFRWLTIDVPRSELRWPDGSHLDERSAILVARSLDKAISGLK